MKTIKDVIQEENPERYAIRYQLFNKTFLLLLQIEGDEFTLTDTMETTKPAQKCNVIDEGLIEDFCYDNNAIDHGILLADIALLHFFNKAIS